MKTFTYDSVSDLIDRWDGFDTDESNDSNLTHRSIVYWCKNDAKSSEKYNIIKNNSITTYIVESMKTKSDYDIAMVLYAIYKDQYVCINIATIFGMNSEKISGKKLIVELH